MILMLNMYRPGYRNNERSSEKEFLGYFRIAYAAAAAQ